MTEVSFPGLGWHFNINNVLFSFGSVEVYWYSILICGGMLLCAILAMLDSKKNHFSEDTVADIMLITIPCAIIGARAYYVICEWDYYKGDIHKILDVRSGGLAVYGGIILTVIGLFVFAKIKKIPFDVLLDYGLAYVPLGQAIGRWGNFFNQEAFGTTTTLPWGMTSAKVQTYLQHNCPNLDSSMPVHPTFLYESLCSITLFFIIRCVRRKCKYRYEVTSLYLIGYGIARFFIEGLRTDSLYIGDTGIRTSQLLSLILVLVGLGTVVYVRYNQLERNELPESCFTVKTAAQVKALEAAESKAKAKSEPAVEAVKKSNNSNNSSKKKSSSGKKKK